MSKLEVHPRACEHLDQLAENLLTSVRPAPKIELSGPQGRIERELPAEMIIDETVIRDLVMSTEDGRQMETGRYFTTGDNIAMGLGGEGFANFRALVAQVAARRELRDLVSSRTVDDLLFRWVRERYSKRMAGKFMPYLSAQMEKEISAYEIWMPIATLCIEEPLSLGNVVLKTITAAHVTSWTSHWSGSEEVSRTQATDRLRSRVRGRAAATFTVTAERRRAEERAIEAAEAAVSMLRVFSVEMLHPYTWSLCSTEGLATLGGSVVVVLRAGEVSSMSHALPQGLKAQWNLTSVKVAELMKHGLAKGHELLTLKKRSEFQSRLLGAMLHYSIACLKKDPGEKLLYVVSALEAMLLDGKEEGQIAQNFRERFALLRTEKLEQRLAVLDRANWVYAERSRFVHGGVTPADLEMLQDFMLDAWVVFGALLRNHEKFLNKSVFLKALDVQKMGGPPFGAIQVDRRR